MPRRRHKLPICKGVCRFCLFVLALALSTTVGAQQGLNIYPIEVLPGPPDLAAQISAAPTQIYGGPNFQGANESSLLTVTVQNRLTPPERPYLFEGRLRF